MVHKEKISKQISPADSAPIMEKVCDCTSSITFYQRIENDINRHGKMVRKTEGLGTKVLNQCPKRNVESGILNKLIFSESSPRIEDEVTEFEEQFLAISA